MTNHVQPSCQHFGTCGGCQYQDLAYEAQLELKRARLSELLQQGGLANCPEIAVHASRSYSYRNRIRLRVQRSGEGFAIGYNKSGTTEFLPIHECCISAPLLVQAAETLLRSAASDRDALHWLQATAEMEVFTNDDLSKLQVSLLCAPRTKSPQGSLDRLLRTLQLQLPQMVRIGAMAFDPRTGPTGRVLAEAGAAGLSYRVTLSNEVSESYWMTRGGFFQVNRFLLPTLVELTCFTAEGSPRAGTLAWDLYSGVGLFSRLLVRGFAQVVAVESNPTAVSDLRGALARLGPQHNVIESTALEFLGAAILQRDRPELIVLDPPRAGAGIEACNLMARIAPQQIVYVSCDPSTLARDLSVLQGKYTISALHLVDLFPQTSHQETIAVLDRNI